MKNKTKFTATFIILLIMTIASQTISAQTDAGGKQYVEIKTSAVCGSCKSTIEKAVYSLDGVKSASLDLKTKIVSVTYNGDKTTATEIKNAIVKAGYDADEMPADSAAYDHLDGCCKKE